MNRTYFLLLLPLKNPTLFLHLYSEIQLSSSILRRNGKELYYKTQFVKCQVPWTPEVHESINHWLFSPLFVQLDYNTCNVAENKTKSSIFSQRHSSSRNCAFKTPSEKILFCTEQIYSGEGSMAVAKDSDKWKLYSWRSVTPHLLPHRFPALEVFPALPRTWQVFWRNELCRELLHRSCMMCNSLTQETVSLDSAPEREVYSSGRKILLL